MTNQSHHIRGKHHRVTAQRPATRQIQFTPRRRNTYALPFGSREKISHDHRRYHHSRRNSQQPPSSGGVVIQYRNTNTAAMFTLPPVYVTAQDRGKAFAADYYGRLNASAGSVADMFAERSRYCSMDSLNGRPAVGRTAVVREVRRFLGAYSGGRRFVKVLSVDAQTDVDDGAKAVKDFGRRHHSDDGSDDECDYVYDQDCDDRDDEYDDYDDHDDRDDEYDDYDYDDDRDDEYDDYDYDDDRDDEYDDYDDHDDHDDHDDRDDVREAYYYPINDHVDDGHKDDGDQCLVVFVHAELTDPTRPQLAPFPFFQTFRVRCLRTENRGDRFEIVITVVKTMAAAVQRLSDGNRKDFCNPERVVNGYEITRGKFKQYTYPRYGKQLNAEDRDFEPWPDVTSTPYPSAQSTDDEQEPSWLICEQYLAYQKMVKEFLAKSTVDRQPLARETFAVNDDDDDDVRPTDRLHVDRLKKSITADQMYAAFSRYGKVLWVCIFPGSETPSDPLHPYHSACVCFDRTGSVDKAMADHRGPGCTVGGVRVSFSRSRPGQ